MGMQVHVVFAPKYRKKALFGKSGASDRISERDELDLDCAECGTVQNFLRHKFWARGYFVSTLGRNEEMIRVYIRKSGDGGQAFGSVAIEAFVLIKSHLSSQNPL
jgi:REP element-mobilizing transposase RayT